MEKNEFQNRVFLFSNFLGGAILNNCDVSWLLYCSDTKSFCLITKGQPFTSQLFKMAAPGNFQNKDKRFYNSCIAGKRALLVKTSNKFDSKSYFL